MYEERQYMIFSTTYLASINFDEVLETSQQTVRKSVDQTKTFVKWNGEVIPTSVSLLPMKEGPYTHSEMLDILATAEWTDNTIV